MIILILSNHNQNNIIQQLKNKQAPNFIDIAQLHQKQIRSINIKLLEFRDLSYQNDIFTDIYNYFLQMEVLQFPKGNLYMIVSKGSQLALRINDPQNSYDSRIIGVQNNPQDINQLWFVQIINNKDFQIVHAMSDLVFQQTKGQIHLRKGKQNSDQLYYLQKAPISQYYQYYWIKTNKDAKQAITLEGIVRYKKFDINDPNQLFRFEPVTNNSLLNSTTVIINSKSGKAIDIPASTKQKGERLIQYSKNKRFNQRWRFIKTGNAYQIQSLLNGLNIDIAGEQKKPNSKVIQWLPTGASNQLWTVESRGNGNYVIRSVHEHTLVLGVKQDNLDDGGKLCIVNFEALWKFEGNVPK